MATPSKKLAESLELLEKLQAAGGAAAIRARDVTRTHRERLMAAGFLQEVIKGWYIPSRPDEVKGESTAWYASFWRFCAAYLDERFGADWCLSPEQSLSLHAGNWTVPRQLMVRSARARNKITKLPHGTSLFDLRAALPAAAARAAVITELKNRSRMMVSFFLAVCYCNGSSPIKPVALSFVAGSEPRPCAKARSSMRAARIIAGKPMFPSMQRGS